MISCSGTITYLDIEFSYEGDMVPYQPAVLRQDWGKSEPAEGGNFEDFQVFIGEFNVTEVLTDKVLETLEEMAVENERQ